MTNNLFRFARDEDGAVTVDWVVLTAAVVGLSIGVVAIVSQGALDQSTGLGAFISSQVTATY